MQFPTDKLIADSFSIVLWKQQNSQTFTDPPLFSQTFKASNSWSHFPKTFKDLQRPCEPCKHHVCIISYNGCNGKTSVMAVMVTTVSTVMADVQQPQSLFPKSGLQFILLPSDIYKTKIASIRICTKKIIQENHGNGSYGIAESDYKTEERSEHTFSLTFFLPTHFQPANYWFD